MRHTRVGFKRINCDISPFYKIITDNQSTKLVYNLVYRKFQGSSIERRVYWSRFLPRFGCLLGVGTDNGARLLCPGPWFWDRRRRAIYFAICWQNAAYFPPAVGFGQVLVLDIIVKGVQSGMCEVFAGQPKENYEPITRNLRLNGQSTSIRLERSFWDIIDSMASAEGVSTPSFLSTLQSEVIEIHGEAKNFTSLLRCACIKKIQLSMNDQSQSVLAQWIDANFRLTISAAPNNNQV